MQKRGFGYEYRTTVLCIDSYENKIPCGSFFNPFEPEGKQFSGVIQFLSQLEETLDDMAFPQSFTITRTFGKSPAQPNESPPRLEARNGKLATLLLRVMFRQNSSWQGSLVWVEGNREQSFRSVLELLFLIDSALTEDFRSD